jgi:hypothetical protein
LMLLGAVDRRGAFVDGIREVMAARYASSQWMS